MSSSVAKHVSSFHYWLNGAIIVIEGCSWHLRSSITDDVWEATSVSPVLDGRKGVAPLGSSPIHGQTGSVMKHEAGGS